MSKMSNLKLIYLIIALSFTGCINPPNPVISPRIMYGGATDVAVAEDVSAGSEGETVPVKPEIAPRPPVEPEFWYSGGYARINAETGEIISLNRPIRYENKRYDVPVGKPEPAPLPASMSDIETSQDELAASRDAK